MAKRRIKKYSRRRAPSPNKRSVAPIIVTALAFILLSLIISVAVGIALGRRAEDAEGDKRFDFEREDYDSNGKTVSEIEAYNFPIEASPQDYVYQGIYDLSVCVSHKGGELAYFFSVAESKPIRENGGRSFRSLCEEARDAGARVCAYLYVESFSVSDRYEREIVKAFEIAIISEMASAGASDILLLGIEPDEDNIDEIENFVARAATAAGKVQLGVAVDEEIIEKNNEGIYMAARLRSACDYLALDLTHLKVSDGESAGRDEDGNALPSVLEEILERNEYYIKSYPMRVIFSQDNFRIYQSALSLGVTDMQIVGE